MGCKVSILIPCYNAKDVARRCLNSILTQTFGDYEIIMVDDGSLEDSFEGIRGISDSRLHLYYKSHGGVADTLDYGLGFCNGEYICRMDVDDLMYRWRLEKQVGFLDSHEEYDLVCGGMTSTDKDGFLTVGSYGYYGELKCSDFVGGGCIIDHPTVMFRKDRFFEVFGKDVYSRDYSCEDYHLWYRCIENGIRMFSLDLPLVVYVSSESQVTVRNKDKICEDSEKVRKMFLDMEKSTRL